MGFRFSAVETAPADQDSSERVLVWIWLVGGSAVLLVGALWMLRKMREEKGAPIDPVITPKPVKPPAPAAITPVAEPEPYAPSDADAQPEPPPTPDDLKKIKGIGPKISQALNEEGIYTFEQLAETDVEVLHTLMVERAWRMAKPDTWPAQARQLAEAKRNKQQNQ